jgi:acetyl-CoA carboxylase carboxyltransferase component
VWQDQPEDATISAVTEAAADKPATFVAPGTLDARVEEARARARAGGSPERKAELAARGKGLARDRIAALLDPGFVIEDWLLARHDQPELPADGVATLVGKINGRDVCVMANDMSVKAGTWGVKTVEKIQRIQEVALTYRIPIVYLVDSGGARIDEQYGMFLDRRHSGRIFWNMARMNGVVPQVCVNFGPSPAGAAYLPAFCDFVVMIEGQTSVYLGSPRQAEAATGEKVDHEQMGGARMHCSVSGLGDMLVATEEEALDAVKSFLSYLPPSFERTPPDAPSREPASGPSISEVVPDDQRKPFDMRLVITALVDEDSFFEIKREFAGELLTGFARIEGMTVGIVANQSLVRGGILTQNSAEKAAQFVSTCNAYAVPLVFLMDVPGFMIGSTYERAAIIRRGQKMLQAVAEAVQPRICVVVRKGYGAGYMAMSGATFQPDCIIALPQAKLGLMGPEAAIQAIYGRKIEELDEEERESFVAEKRAEYERDIGVFGPAAEMFVDDIVPGHELRHQLATRLALYRSSPARPKVLIERRSHIMRG